jgi:phosphoglycolate phosphatase
MTSADGGTTLAEILASTRILLLDFDGPVTQLMPDGVDHAIADTMREVLRQMTGSIPDEVADTTDPLAVLRAAATESPDVLAAVEDACRAGEVDAANRSHPTDGAHDAMSACRDAGRPIIIVSNNAPEAIDAYLERYGLRDLVLEISARPPGRPDLMKPDPYLVRQVFQHHAERPDHYAFVGDSVTDVQVSQRTGVRAVGFAKTIARGQDLQAAGADVLIHTMQELRRATDLIRQQR